MRLRTHSASYCVRRCGSLARASSNARRAAIGAASGPVFLGMSPCGTRVRTARGTEDNVSPSDWLFLSAGSGVFAGLCFLIMAVLDAWWDE